MKVTAIEEAQDIATIKVEELIGSLLTCEVAINERTDKKFNVMNVKDMVTSDLSAPPT
jgi:hypothetical protein